MTPCQAVKAVIKESPGGEEISLAPRELARLEGEAETALQDFKRNVQEKEERHQVGNCRADL